MHRARAKERESERISDGVLHCLHIRTFTLILYVTLKLSGINSVQSHVRVPVVMLLVKEHPCLFTFLPTMNIHLENSNLYTYILAYVHSPATYVGL